MAVDGDSRTISIMFVALPQGAGCLMSSVCCENCMKKLDESKVHMTVVLRSLPTAGPRKASVVETRSHICAEYRYSRCFRMCSESDTSSFAMFAWYRCVRMARHPWPHDVNVRATNACEWPSVQARTRITSVFPLRSNGQSIHAR